MLRLSTAAASRRAGTLALGTMLCLSLLSCGGGGSGGGALAPPSSPGGSSGGGSDSSTSNVATVVIDAGPSSASPDVNTLFTTVTVCIPGSSNCQTIDHIQVDTASYGLRILAPVLSLALPLQATNGTTLLECTVFADGYSWGPIAAADVQIAGESASAVPIQIIGDSRFATVPDDCSGSGQTAEDSVATFGANGILGIGVFAQDCGSACATAAASPWYYACTSSVCQATAVPLASQVTNPISLFATDNNGSMLQLPSVAAQGAASLSGSLIFGIDTQSNNQSGSETVLTVDPGSGDLVTLFNGESLSGSFIDTGSNAIYFDDADLAQCSNSGFQGFYCPAATQNLTATLQGQNGITASANFSVGNVQSLINNNPGFTVFASIAGTYTLPGTSGSSGSFDWGLPFYFGRRVATALEAATTSAGTGPYVAF